MQQEATLLTWSNVNSMMAVRLLTVFAMVLFVFLFVKSHGCTAVIQTQPMCFVVNGLKHEKPAVCFCAIQPMSSAQ